MKRISPIAFFFATLFLTSCERDGLSSADGDPGNMILTTDAASLRARMDHRNSGVLDLYDGLAGRNGESTGSFPMSLVAELLPPVYNGQTLRASHVEVQGNYVYVSYNTEGDAYLGGLDVIDISSPNNPQLVVQAILPNVDLSTVLYDNGKLYIAGAVDIDQDATLASPAFVGNIHLQGGLPSASYSPVSLPGQVATGLAVSGSHYFAVTGSNGVAAKLNKNTHAIEASIDIDDLRAMGRFDNRIVVLSGTQGVKVFNADTMAQLNGFSVGSDVPEAKRTIDVQGQNLITAAGYQGMKVYDLNNGNLLQSLPLPEVPTGVDASDVVTNAVSVNGDFVYAANGGAGIQVHKKQSGQLATVGSIQLTGSANYVKSAGNYIFVADGRGGLKIIKRVNVSSIDCTSFATYTGGPWLNVNSNESFNYQGAAALQGLNVNANLTWCGSLSVTQGLHVNSGGVFTMKGSLAQGQANGGSALIVNGTMKIEGDVVVYGNLILNSGANLQFLGSNSSITVYGTVTKNSGVTISGTFNDVLNKLN